MHNYSYPSMLAMDSSNNLYISEKYRVRRVSRDGIITTVAGTAVQDYSDDGGPATAAGLGNIHGLAIDSSGDLYISDDGRVRMVSPAGIITTVAGYGGGDYGSYQGLAIDSAGNIYVADSANDAVRLLQPLALCPSALSERRQRPTGPVAPGEMVVIGVPDSAPRNSSLRFRGAMVFLAPNSRGRRFRSTARPRQ